MFKIAANNNMLNKAENDNLAPQRIDPKQIDSADELDDPGHDEVAFSQKVPESKVKQNTDYFYTKPTSPTSPDFIKIESPSKEKDTQDVPKNTVPSKEYSIDEIKYMMYNKSPREAREDYIHTSNPKHKKAISSSVNKIPSETYSPSKERNYPYPFNASPTKVNYSPYEPDSGKKSIQPESSAYSELAHKLYAEKFYSEPNGGSRKMGLQVETGNLLSQKAVQKVVEKKYITKNEQQETTQRLVKGAEIKKQYKNALTDAYLSKEQQECTFAPKINSASEKPRRNLKQFLEDQKTYQNQVETKKKKKQEQAELAKLSAETTYKPELCEKSVKMLAKTTRAEGGNIHDRLYLTAKNAQGKIAHNIADANLGERGSAESNFVGSRHRLSTTSLDGSTFVPTIDKKSKNLKRGQRIDNLLYNDAMRRQNKHTEIAKSSKSPAPTTTSTMSLNSKRAIATRFIKEFDIAILEFLEVGKEPKLNYIQINEFLRKLCFLKESEQLESPQFTPERLLLYDMWYILYGDKYKGIHRRNLLVFLLAVVNLNFPITLIQKGDDQFPLQSESEFNGDESIPKLRESGAVTEGDQQPLERKIVGQFDDDGNYIINQQDVDKIHKMYNLWYMNRLCASDNIGQLISARSYEDFTYQPQINEASRHLANNYREKILEGTAELIQQNKIPAPKDGKITHVDLLIVSKKVVQEKVNKYGSIINEERSKQYTFRPKTEPYQSGSMNTSTMRSFQGEEKSELRSPGKKNNPMPAGSLGSSRVFELYSLAKPQALKRNKNSDEVDFEKNQDECTFQPNIHRSQQRFKTEPSGQGEIYAKGIEKAIERMRTAQAEKDYTKSMMQRGYGSTGGEGGFVFSMDRKFKKNEFSDVRNTEPQYYTQETGENEEEMYEPREGASMEDNGQEYNNENGDYEEQRQLETEEGMEQNQEEEQYQEQYQEQDQEDNYYMENQNNSYKARSDQLNNSQRRNESFQQKSNVQEAEQQEEQVDTAPLLFVDVNLGHGKSERIVIHEGDNANELAGRFCDEHNLDNFMQDKLRELLESQIAGLLTRIEEEDGSSPSDSRGNRYGGQYDDGNQIQEEDDYVEEDSYGKQ